MTSAGDLAADAPGLGAVGQATNAHPLAEARVRAAVAAHTNSVWRTLRRLGVREADVDDGVQQVFTIFARRLSTIADGAERSFVLATAIRVASDQRRSFRRRKEELLARPARESSDEGHLSPELLLDRRRGLELLDRVLAQLPQAQRVVLVLCEIEGFTLVEAAELLSAPLGTVASRLHRARQRFEQLSRAAEKAR